MRRAGVALDETNRVQWNFTPYTAVGPLRFGMTHEEVVTALGGFRPSAHFGELGFPGPLWAQFHEVAVTTYYRKPATLSCVAVDALHGPQVTMHGILLTGRVPSELAREFGGYAKSHCVRIEVSQHGDPGADALGLVLRTQRAGDVLLTRPVFVAREWADGVSDVSEGSVPQVEWSQR
jgi:hypothetical protein